MLTILCRVPWLHEYYFPSILSHTVTILFVAMPLNYSGTMQYFKYTSLVVLWVNLAMRLHM